MRAEAVSGSRVCDGLRMRAHSGRYWAKDATSGWAVIFFVSLVFLGSFFVLNLALVARLPCAASAASGTATALLRPRSALWLVPLPAGRPLTSPACARAQVIVYQHEGTMAQKKIAETEAEAAAEAGEGGEARTPTSLLQTRKFSKSSRSQPPCSPGAPDRCRVSDACCGLRAAGGAALSSPSSFPAVSSKPSMAAGALAG